MTLSDLLLAELLDLLRCPAAWRDRRRARSAPHHRGAEGRPTRAPPHPPAVGALDGLAHQRHLFDDLDVALAHTRLHVRRVRRDPAQHELDQPSTDEAPTATR